MLILRYALYGIVDFFNNTNILSVNLASESEPDSQISKHEKRIFSTVFLFQTASKGLGEPSVSRNFYISIVSPECSADDSY